MDTRKRLDVVEIGRRIAERRDHMRLDQEQLAERARVSRPYISRLERGIVPNPKLLDLEQVANALDMTIVELVRQPPGTRTDRYSIECDQLTAQLADEPESVADAILTAWRQSVEIARVNRLARSN